MIGLPVILDGDGCWPDLASKEVIDTRFTSVCLLKGGMTSGAYSVSFRTDLPDGRVVICQVSLALLETTVQAFQGRRVFDAGL